MANFDKEICSNKMASINSLVKTGAKAKATSRGGSRIGGGRGSTGRGRGGGGRGVAAAIAGAAAAPAPVMGDAFAATFATMGSAPPVADGVTANGDPNFSTLTQGYSADMEGVCADILAMLNKMVMDTMKAMNPKVSGPIKKRKGQKKQSPYPNDKIPAPMQRTIKTQFTAIVRKVNGIVDASDRTNMITIIGTSMFRERAITGGRRANSGKGHRALSFFLFQLFYEHFPVEGLALLPLFKDYGCWKDYLALWSTYYGKDTKIMDAIVDLFVDQMNNDCIAITKTDRSPGRSMPCVGSGVRMSVSQFRTMTESIAFALGDEVSKHSYEHIVKTYPFAREVSLVWKFIPNNRDTTDPIVLSLREHIMAKVMVPGGMSNPKYLAPKTTGISKWSPGKKGKTPEQKYTDFVDSTMRYMCSSMRVLSGVVEVWMCKKNWGGIDPSKVPSGAAHKHRLAFLNEKVGEMLDHYQQDTGNRSTDSARIALRKKTLSAAMEGKLHGANLDSMKFTDSVWHRLGSISPSEKVVIHELFMDLVRSHRIAAMEAYENAMQEWIDNGSDPVLQPTNPLNVISTVDVSGSMGSEMGYAVVNGLIVAALSNLGRVVITFDTNPRLVHLQGDNVVDWMAQVKAAPWGGSTNMDRAFNLLLQVMKDVDKRMCGFDGKIIHIIHTDGQFNPHFAGFGPNNASTSYGYASYYGSSGSGDYSKEWNPFVDRMKKRCAEAGFALPLTAFWNYRSNTKGFPAHGKYEGVVLVEGLGSGVLGEVLANKVTFKVDAAGQAVAAADPIDNFLKSIAHPCFDPIRTALYETKFGTFADAAVVANCTEFWKFYAPPPKADDAGGAAPKAGGK